jgi:3-deoxy-7-phosphoheptulonate synthase
MNTSAGSGPVSPVQEVNPAKDWYPESWQKFTALQQANYPDQDALENALVTLASLPPLVTSWEILSLREQIAEAQAGKRFVLQGGDCAESFHECSSPLITNRLKVLLQMSLALVHGLQMPVVRIGRFAGQYAKPRSSDLETRGGVSAMTMNFVRSLVDGGFADVHHTEYWDLSWLEHSPLADEFHKLTESLGQSLRFMETITGRDVGSLRRVDFFTSHEALHLHYEQAQTRQVPRQWGWFNLGTHFPWIGMRTADLDGAHVEYFRGIRNPLGIKVGAGMDAGWLAGLLEKLNPGREAGRIVLIHRLGESKIEQHLPGLIQAVQDTGSPVLWISDPMHGNTESTGAGIKTRRFRKIMGEMELAFEIHRAGNSRLGGVHLELTGENVTECTGGARDLSDEDLKRDYKTTVDPRLNYEQSLEMAMLIVRKHAQGS